MRQDLKAVEENAVRGLKNYLVCERRLFGARRDEAFGDLSGRSSKSEG
jgi:hypothetical protein